jgi:hypothetical protein
MIEGRGRKKIETIINKGWVIENYYRADRIEPFKGSKHN